MNGRDIDETFNYQKPKDLESISEEDLHNNSIIKVPKPKRYSAKTRRDYSAKRSQNNSRRELISDDQNNEQNNIENSNSERKMYNFV